MFIGINSFLLVRCLVLMNLVGHHSMHARLYTILWHNHRLFLQYFDIVGWVF